MSLLNQALFFSSIQDKHSDSTSDYLSDCIINSFVKSSNGMDFHFSAVLGPMFVIPDKAKFSTPNAVRSAIENAKNGVSVCAHPILSMFPFII